MEVCSSVVTAERAHPSTTARGMYPTRSTLAPGQATCAHRTLAEPPGRRLARGISIIVNDSVTIAKFSHRSRQRLSLDMAGIVGS